MHTHMKRRTGSMLVLNGLVMTIAVHCKDACITVAGHSDSIPICWQVMSCNSNSVGCSTHLRGMLDHWWGERADNST